MRRKGVGRKGVRTEWHCRLIHNELRQIATNASFYRIFPAFLIHGFSQSLSIPVPVLALIASFVSPFVPSGSAIQVRTICAIRCVGSFAACHVVGLSG